MMQGRFFIWERHSGYPEKASAHLRVQSSLSLFYFLFIPLNPFYFCLFSCLFPSFKITFISLKIPVFLGKNEEKKKEEETLFIIICALT